MANGSPNPTWNATTPRIVPKMCRFRYSDATGSNATWIGTTINPTTTTNSQSRPRKSIQANAYAASAPRNTTSTVAGTVISTVFHSDWMIPLLLKTSV